MRHFGAIESSSPCSSNENESNADDFQQPIYGKFNVPSTSSSNRNQQKSENKKQKSKANQRFYGQMKADKGRSDEFIFRENNGGARKFEGGRRQRNSSPKLLAGIRGNLRQHCSAFWQQLIRMHYGQHLRRLLANILIGQHRLCGWPAPNNRCLSLLALFLFLLLLLCLATFALLHLLDSPNASPSAFFLLALLTFVLLASTLSALSAIFRPQNGAAIRLRPLLLMTCLLPLLGLPIILLPLPHCFRLPQPIGLQCSPLPFPLVALSLLLGSLLLLRPLLQHWLAKLRLAACLYRLKAHPLEVATHFNIFLARLEAFTTSDDAQWELAALIAQWKEGFGQQLHSALEEAEAAEHLEKYGNLGLGQFEFEIGAEMEEDEQLNESGKGRKRRGRKKNGRKKSILMRRKEGSKSNSKENDFIELKKRRVQFSQLLLLREISSVQNEIGQLVRMDKHQKFVLESLYADFVRDFRLKMDSSGHLRVNSAHQIFTRFGPVETMHYTKLTANQTGKEIYGNLGEEKSGEVEIGQKAMALAMRRSKGRIEGAAKGAIKGRKPADRKDRDYATIDSAGEATNDLMRRAVAKCLAGRQSASARPQLQPQVPSTPIPQTTPTDPQGPQFGDGSNRGTQQQNPQPLLMTLYENFAARMAHQQNLQQQQGHRMEEVKEEVFKEMEEEEFEERKEEKANEVRLEMSEEREEEDEELEAQIIRREKLMEKQSEKVKRGKCNCPLAEDCMVLTNSRARAHYYYLMKPGKNRGAFEVLEERINMERNESDDDDAEGNEGEEENGEETCYFSRR